MYGSRTHANQHKYYHAEVAKGIPATAKYANVRRLRGSDRYVKTIAGVGYEIIFHEDIRDWILDYYNDINNPGALRGRDVIYNAIKSKYVGISRRDIEHTLGNIETQQVHSIAPVVKISRPMTPAKPLARWCADITYVTNAQDQRLFSLLTCVDVFSKYAWARIINAGPAKYTAKTVADAMGEIIDGEGKHLPAVMQTDNGTDFKNAAFAAVMTRHGIKHHFIDTYSARQNAHVERFNLTIKTAINKYLTHVNGITIDPESLQKLVAGYNSCVHTTTGRRPVDVHPGKGATTAERSQAVKHAKLAIDGRAAMLLEANERLFPLLRVGDIVRVHKRTTGEWRRQTTLKKKAYQKQWFFELYKVAHISRPHPTKAPHFTLFDIEAKHDVPRKFLRQDLLRIDQKQLIKENPEGHWNVRKIVGRKMIRGKLHYGVIWDGYPDDEVSWILPQESFQGLIDKYGKR